MSGTFIGTYENSISNRRISIPQAFRKQFSTSSKNKITIIRGRMSSLQIYPYDNWKKIENKLKNGSDKEKNLLRSLRLYSTECEIEGPGRILLPQNLLDICNLDKKAVFLGEGNYFTLWNPQKFAEYKKQIDDKYEEIIRENLNML